ncbi:MAG: hypothetical protein JWO13_2059 [Acidobacteriales bacterium]|nr:hypothetical protein [Terriglobales bacterium]
MKSYHPETPIPFDVDWHHQFGNKLAVFPRNLCFRNEVLQLDYWPDLTTFTEDYETSLLMYYPPAASRFSICVIYRKLSGTWDVVKYCDDIVLQRATGQTFESAMQNIVTQGLTWGEA